MCSNLGIHVQVSIDTLDPYPQTTSQSVLNWLPNEHSNDTSSTGSKQSAECQSTHMGQLKIS